MTNTETLQMSITLPGSASLGAYQAGAMAALDVAIRALEDAGTTVNVAAVGGSSAGSIVAMLFTHAHVTGRSAESILREAWIDEVDIDLLSDGGRLAPLGFDDLERKIRDFLADRDRFPYGVHPSRKHPVTLRVGLTTLQGFVRSVETCGSAVSSLDYADAACFEVVPDADHLSVTEPSGVSALDAVLASATHPGAFAPRLLDRSRDEERLRNLGVENLPDPPSLWYTDGGLVESRPVGAVLEAAREHPLWEPDSPHIHLVVDPRGSGASGHEEWSDGTDPKNWVAGLRRAVSILPTQALHDDLRGVRTVNHRIEAIDELADRLVETHADPEELRTALHRAAGTMGKAVISVEMISPLLVDAEEEDADGVANLLAGDFIGAFGGFLARSVRRSDYALGWRSTRIWVRDALEGIGVPADHIAQALRALDHAETESWDTDRVEGDGMDELDAVNRWRLVAFAGRAASHLLRAAAPTPSMPRGFRDRRRRGGRAAASAMQRIGEAVNQRFRI